MTLGILVLAGSHVYGLQLLVSLFILSAGAGGLLTWGISKLRIRQVRKMLGLAAAILVGVAMPEILTNVCSFCWWCWC